MYYEDELVGKVTIESDGDKEFHWGSNYIKSLAVYSIASNRIYSVFHKFSLFYTLYYYDPLQSSREHGCIEHWTFQMSQNFTVVGSKAGLLIPNLDS